MKIIDAKLTFSNENLISPFGFKGSYVDYLTIVKCEITTDKTNGVGYGLQSILWSDAGVFSNLGNDKVNELMLKITNYALTEIKNVSGDNPISIIDKVYNKVLNYAKSLYANLRETFVKNALVAVDNALWQAYGKENNVTDITKIIPTLSPSSSILNIINCPGSAFLATRGASISISVTVGLRLFF